MQRNLARTDQHLDDLFPCREPLDEDIRRLELMRGGVFLDLEVSAASNVWTGPTARLTKDWFLDTVDTRDSVLEMVSNLDMVVSSFEVSEREKRLRWRWKKG